ncbi:MAG TPA: zinc ribbon domain-containing protein [Gaiellaceae bacterium]|nr:zinc ribbon domain-containing protein [Gaiellaceae bacterium]
MDPVSPTVCAVCTTEAPEDARFCPQCGAELGQRVTDESPPVEWPTVLHDERRVFGLAPPAVVFAIAMAGFALAIFLLATGHLVLGAVLLIAASWFGAFFASLARRMPQSKFARLSVDAGNTVRGWAWYAWVSLSSWSSAGRKAVRLRAAQRRLRHEQSGVIRDLGDAVYRADETRADELKAKAQALGKQIEESERELRLVLDATRSRIGRERSAIRPTQVLVGPPARKNSGEG